ncbi:hypothetical protein D5018_07365 [Parashewanella curva]|uniref:Uncharacterized protein n=1 Tax=Parashewanella curva TaxID=2338552 RepID=A0A3L8PY04_9GAMM|nr:hypothetical protein [Parashewanella curva]RLV60337.1 hypothetical protein D5018_07365 [Parashewanella curva]
MATSGVVGAMYWKHQVGREEFYDLAQITLGEASQCIDRGSPELIEFMLLETKTWKTVKHSMLFAVKEEANNQGESFKVILISRDKSITEFMTKNAQHELRCYLSESLKEYRKTKKDKK